MASAAAAVPLRTAGRLPAVLSVLLSLLSCLAIPGLARAQESPASEPNGAPTVSAPPLIVRSAGNPVSLSATVSDPDDDPLTVVWGKETWSLLYGFRMGDVFPPAWFPSTVEANPYQFIAPSLAVPGVIEYTASVSDGRGGSAVASTWLTVLASPSPGDPPIGTIEVGPTSGPPGTTVTVSYDGWDPEGGSLRWGYSSGAGGSCCLLGTVSNNITLNSPGVYRFSGQAIDQEMLLSAYSSVVVRIGGAAGEPPMADLFLDLTSGPAPLTVSYDATGSYDPDGATVQFSLDCDAAEPGGTLSTAPTGMCTFETPGPHAVRLKVSDSDGYSDERIAYVMVTPEISPDVTAPTVQITAPAADAVVTGVVDVDVEADDDVGVVRVELYRDAASVALDTAAPWELTWNAGAASPGDHTLVVKAYDQAGNIGTASLPVRVKDTVPPTGVAMVAPTNGASVSGLVTLEATASDNVGVVKVEFFRGSGTLLGMATAAPWQITWDSTSAPLGATSLWARAYDRDNATSSASISVTVADGLPPTVAVTAPASGATVSGTVSLTAEASDNVGVAQVEFLVDGTLLGTATAAPWSLTWNSVSIVPGLHVLSARARDAAGNTATSAEVAVTVRDITPPTVAITSPPYGAGELSGTVSIEAQASDNAGVVRVEFFLDTDVLLGTDATAPWGMAWDVSTVTPGLHTLTARAYDQEGNSTTSAPRSIDVEDVEPPTVTLTEPADGATVSGSISITADAADNVGVTEVAFYRDNGVLLGRDYATPWSLTWDSATALGPHTLYARASDQEGNVTTSATVSITARDGVAPTVYMRNPTAGETIWGVFLVGAEPRDDVGVTRVEFFRDNGVLLGTATSSPWNVSWDSTATLGEHTLYAKAYDQAGNVGTSAAVAITVRDGIAPTLAWTAPAAGSTVSGVVTLEVSASDDVGVTRVEFSRGSVLIGTDTAAPWSLAWDSTATLGAQFLYAKAYDEAGNTRVVGPISLTVRDGIAPNVSLTSPAANASLAATVSVTASASDDVGVVRVELYRDAGVLLGTDTASPWSILWNTALEVPGAHTLYVIAYDQAGNSGTSAQVPVTVRDSLAPSIAITSPAAGATVPGPVTVTFDASDNVGVVKVELYRDAGFLIGTDTETPWEITWNNGTLFGARTLFAKAYDQAGNVRTSASVSVTVVDGVAPTASLTAPAAGASVSGNVLIQVTASDNVGVTRVEFFRDNDVLLGTDTASPWSLTWDSTATLGDRTLYAKAFDAAGNSVTTAPVSITVRDGLRPTVAITAPASGSTVSGAVPIDVDATDDVGVVKIEIYRSGSAEILGTDTSAPWGIVWNTSTQTAPMGAQTLYAKAYDQAGNTATSATISVTVLDTAPPAVSVTAPVAGSTVSGTAVTLSANASDSVGVVKVEFYLDSTVLLGTDTVSPWSIAWDSTATPGNHTLSAKAYDQAGNVGTSAAVSIRVLDVAPPTVALTAPANGATVGGLVAVEAAAADNVGVVKVELYRSPGFLLGTDTAAPWGFAWDSSTVVPGPQTLYAKAYDADGNVTTSASVSVTVRDTTAPSVSLTSPAAGASISGLLALNATASDNVGVVSVEFLLDSGTLLGTDTASPWSLSWDSSTVTPGAHTLTVRAYDQEGNVATSSAVAVTVLDTIPPTVSMTSPTAGALLVGTVSLTATASDNVGVARVELYRDSTVLLGTATAAPWTISWDSSTATPGSHTLHARAYDQQGNATSSSTFSVTVVDVISPSVSITSPAQGSRVTRNTTVTISASASDNVGVTRVEFYVGTTLRCTDTTSPYTCAWAVPKNAGVSYSLQAKAYDARGNIGTSTVVQVTSQ